jgi:hypothetical protein
MMRERLSLMLRSALYALRGGFLIRPFLIALFFGAVGSILSFAEEYEPGLDAWIPEVLFPAHQDPQVALTILAGIAGSIMTVVSIVFAILLMTLTLASTQFSPRILVSFVRDRATQWTLGIFLGTFSYCMAALPAVRSLPHPYVPVLTVLVAMLLALVSVGWLIFFINHISLSISVNNIVDRIARETEFAYPPFARGARASDSRAQIGIHPLRRCPLSRRVRQILRRSDRAGAARRRLHSRRGADPAGRRCRPSDPGARGPPADGYRHRPRAHDAARRRVWNHPDCRHRPAGDFARRQRSYHRDKLY